MMIKRIVCALIAALMLISALPVINVSAKEDVDPSKAYTMWGNNILMSNIAENGSKKNPDGTFVFDTKPENRYLQLYSAIEHYLPDIIAFQECDGGWHSLIDDHEGYATKNGFKPFSTLGYSNVLSTDKYRIEGVRNPIYYKTGKFDIVDSGVVSYGDPSNNYYEDPWVFSWAILEDKANGNRFAVGSTHISSKPAGDTVEKQKQIQELIAFMKALEAKERIPFVVMGDYNCDFSYELAYGALEIGEKTLSARDVSKVVKGNTYCTSNHLGKIPSTTSALGGGVIDHAIMSTVGFAPEEYHTLVEVFDQKNNIATYTYSDHVPQLFKFRVVGSDHKHTGTVAEKYDADTHYVECPDCYLGDYVKHDFGAKCDPKVEKEQNTVTCKECGESSVYHDYQYSYTGSGANDNHTARCVSCGRTELVEPHRWSTKRIAPTYASDGYDLYRCELCGAERKEASGEKKFDIPKYSDELGAGGQLVLYTGNADRSAPVADGKISQNEYSLKIENMKSENDEEDDRFYLQVKEGKTCDIENVNIYFSHDKDNIYIGAEVTDNAFCANKYTDALCIYIGTTGKSDELDMFYMPRYTSGVVEAFPYDKEIRTAQEAEQEGVHFVDSHCISNDKNVITYEVVFKRSELSDKKFDQILFGVIVRSGVGTRSKDAALVFGFTTEGLGDAHLPYSEGLSDTYLTYEDKNFYPHVLKFSREPKTEATETAVPETAAPESELRTAESEVDSSCGALLAPSALVTVSLVGLFATITSAKKRSSRRK